MAEPSEATEERAGGSDSDRHASRVAEPSEATDRASGGRSDPRAAMRRRLERPRSPLSRPVREAAAATDWAAVAVLDVVTYAPATSLGFEGDRQRIETYRYLDRAPPVSTYENGERSFRVTRLTEPLWERFR